MPWISWPNIPPGNPFANFVFQWQARATSERSGACVQLDWFGTVGSCFGGLLRVILGLWERLFASIDTDWWTFGTCGSEGCQQVSVHNLEYKRTLDAPSQCLSKVSSTDARVWTEFALSAASSGLCSPWDRRRLPSAVWQRENRRHYIASRAPDKAG